eukprot:CAMPEP_0174716138 /NCGR_PEP_ID=MMETSP1094-20130205/23003_1 /TAXON_ID=156173 /ORGANISM="Chrysochromulina brevifilum, Strain UTEX LB 985" /LENGTH=59 /DNA_ID=CAMNT_0015915823 /DNA_START=754 /DNA_END=933 /DNA_ORIENTATION=-
MTTTTTPERSPLFGCASGCAADWCGLARWHVRSPRVQAQSNCCPLGSQLEVAVIQAQGR